MKTILLKTKSIILILCTTLCVTPIVQAQSSHPGFFNDNWVPKTIEVTAFDTVEPVTQPATVTVTVDADSVLSKVSKYVYGQNAGVWGGKLNQYDQVVKDLSELDPHIIRWPGGNLSNDYFWNATSKATCPGDLPPDFTYSDNFYGANKDSWTMPLDAYYDLLKKTNSTGMITVNYAYARYSTSEDPVLTAAKYAADWVRYDNGRTRYWEIGNENFGNWETGYTIDQSLNKDGQPKTISGDLYGKHCRVFIEEMRKAAKEVGNDIKIGVVAMDQPVTWDAVQQNWNAGMMKQVGDMADFIIVHSYHTPYDQNSGISTILNSYTASADIKTYIDNGMKAAGKDPLPMALTEWNIFATGSGQGVSYINGMHASLVLGELIKEQYGQGSRWDLVNGWNNGDNHGLLADGEPGIPRYTPRAPFFYMYYFQKYFGDRMVYSSVSGSTDVVSFASDFSSGQSGVVLINKGSSSQVVSVKMKDFKPGSHYYYYLLTGGTDNGDFSPKVYVNGKTGDLSIGGPADYATMMPYGDTIQGDIMLTMPGYSVINLLVEQDTSLLAQSVQFDGIPDMALKDTSFVITASATSGLPVRFASMNPGVAKVNGDTVKVIGAGTCSIIAYQDGDTVYKPAEPVIDTFVVAKADQVITMDSISDVVYDPEPITIPASASSELPVQLYSSNLSVATITRDGQVQLKSTGSTTITATQQGNANYNAAEWVKRTMNVLKADQTITFPSLQDKTILDAAFVPAAEASSGLAVSYSSSDTEVASVYNNKIQIEGVGTATITASQSGNNIYNAADPVSQNLTVTKANQTITFFPLPDKTIGDPDFSPVATASSGLQVSFTSSDTTVAKILNNMISVEGEGNATITAHQPGDDQYNAAPNVTQELTVSPYTGIGATAINGHVLISPDPATEAVHIRFNKKNYRITIYNVLGSVVFQSKVAADEFTVPVSQIGQPGIYFLRAGELTRKFTIAR